MDTSLNQRVLQVLILQIEINYICNSKDWRDQDEEIFGINNIGVTDKRYTQG